MSREIKFRAWLPQKKKMAMVTELIGSNKAYAPEKVQAEYFDEYGQQFHTSSTFELMQYTGLKDKNGKEIYEGDIVSCKGSHNTALGEVLFVKGQFILEGRTWTFKKPALVEMYDNRHAELEVIGNIYENPELLTP